MRTFVVVPRPGATTTPEQSTPAPSNLPSSSRPGESSPTTPTMAARAPSAARFIAQLAAPPGTVSVRSCRRIITGASRDTRLISPDTNWSAIRSPSTKTRRPQNARTSAASRPVSAIPSTVICNRVPRTECWLVLHSVLSTYYLPDCFEQVFGDEVGAVLPGAALVFVLAAAVAGQDEGGADARVARQLRVAVAVADHPAPREVDAQLFGRAADEAGPGLAAVAVEAVRRLADRRVMRAVVDGVEPRAALLQFGGEDAVDAADHLLREIAARHAGLVGDEDGEPAR